ncbi:MAG TPA: hypothetical protein VHQ24_15185, partial [Lachnospiraceae bacterium]|nr:hypothetical protein [Lachnospiraceae bacterium]
MRVDNHNSRKIKDNLLRLMLIAASAVSVLILVVIIGFVFVKGLPGINLNFLTRDWENNTTFVNVERKEVESDTDTSYIASLGISIEQNEEGNYAITKIDNNSTMKDAKNLQKEAYEVKVDDIITRIDAKNASDLEIADVNQLLESSADTIKLKITRPGGGIKPMVVSTLYIILLSLAISAPVGVLTALYLNEYAKKGRTLEIIRFAIRMLAGIPSIIYGLFGMLVFVQMFKMQYSILAGAFTLSILLSIRFRFYDLIVKRFVIHFDKIFSAQIKTMITTAIEQAAL